MIEASYWFLFPIAVFVATMAMMGGIGAAIFFSPIFILLGVDPLVAIASGLIIEVFGFSSGLAGYYRRKEIDFSVAKQLLWYSVPAAIVGVVLGQFVNIIVLQVLLVLLLVYLGVKFLFNAKKECKKVSNVTASSKRLSSFGGLLMGMISSGLGELDEYIFLERMKMKPAIASGTSVFLMAITALVGVISHGIFIMKEPQLFVNALSLVVFSVPGVILGAQTGVYAVQRANNHLMEGFLGGLFFILAGVMIFTLF